MDACQSPRYHLQRTAPMKRYDRLETQRYCYYYCRSYYGTVKCGETLYLGIVMHFLCALSMFNADFWRGNGFIYPTIYQTFNVINSWGERHFLENVEKQCFKCVFKLRRYCVLMLTGREFQRVGAAIEEALVPITVLVLGTHISSELDDRSWTDWLITRQRLLSDSTNLKNMHTQY